MLALGYTRRSKESTARTVSLDAQRHAVADYCARQGWQLAEVLEDDGISGGRRERLERLAARVKATGARYVVVYHLDRFARDLAGMLDSLRRFARQGVELHVVGRGRVETDTAAGYLVAGVEGLMAEHYKKLVSEKTRDALARLRQQGRRFTRVAPYGYAFREGRMETETLEQAVLTRIGELRGLGHSLRRMAEALTAEGQLARGGAPFRASTLAVLVHRRSAVDSAAVATG